MKAFTAWKPSRGATSTISASAILSIHVQGAQPALRPT
jgi:hypothetical protein